MAGIKGKGGVKGKSGGTRAGAGRKPKPKADPAESNMQPALSVTLEPQPNGGALKRSKAKPVPIEEMDMLQMLQAVALGKTEATMLQVRAAIAAVQYTHIKKGDGGKKEEAADKAAKASIGRFGATAPPRLVANNR